MKENSQLSFQNPTLADYVNTFGQDMLRRYGKRVHKIAIDAALTCPNRDGKKGRGGCTFCNVTSFSPNTILSKPVVSQINSGKDVIRKRTRAMNYIAYFQTYSNTYADISELRDIYKQALAEKNMIGISVGTRPDCLNKDILELLTDYKNQGFEVWLELGLQSSFDNTLQRVNRGHTFDDYRRAVDQALQYDLNICTHLMLGLPGENRTHALTTLQRTLEQNINGLKLHPLHIVRGTQLANDWRLAKCSSLDMEDYIETVCDMIELTPTNVVFHRLTGTASLKILLAPLWCNKKWLVLNAIKAKLEERKTYQGINAGKISSCHQ